MKDAIFAASKIRIGQKSRVILIAGALALTCATNHAALLVYEGFDYTGGNTILGASGGFGWSGVWTKDGNANATEIATSPGLTYGDLVVEGNMATLTGATAGTGSGNSSFPYRNTTDTFGTDGTELWVSFIGQRTGSQSGAPLSYQRVFSLAFFNGGTEMFSIGELSNDPADTWALNPTTAVVNSVHTTVPIDTQSFLLVKIVFGAGALNDSAFLWANYDISLGEPAEGTAQATIAADDLTFNRIRMSAGGSQTGGTVLAASGLMDEIRVGDTFADVTPVPEPATLGMLGAGALLAFGWQRSRRKAGSV